MATNPRWRPPLAEAAPQAEPLAAEEGVDQQAVPQAEPQAEPAALPQAAAPPSTVVLPALHVPSDSSEAVALAAPADCGIVSITDWQLPDIRVKGDYVRTGQVVIGYPVFVNFNGQQV